MVTRQRLSPDDWLKAGVDALARLGPEGLKAEPLARALETTKGSFYWHFPDVPTYQKRVLEYWSASAAAPEAMPEKKKEAVAELKRLMEDGFGELGATEAAMRTWARTDADAAAALSRIDEGRMERIRGLLEQVGVTNPDIPRALYAARIGAGEIAHSTDSTTKAAIETLVDLVLALR